MALDVASMSRVARRIEEWKLKLIDLSRRNRLIYFSPAKSSNVQIIAPAMKAIFDRLVVRGKGWEIFQPPRQALDPRKSAQAIKPGSPTKTQLVPDETDAQLLERTLRNLARRSASEYRERGIRILYATFGTLNWREADSGEAIRSPIILVPIELGRARPIQPYGIRVPEVEEEAILNPALQLKLKTDFKIELPPMPDLDELDLPAYLEAVSAAGGDLGWSADAAVNLGLFSFYKLVMYQDLVENVDHIAGHPIISALAGAPSAPLVRAPLPNEASLDEIVDPRRTFQVLDADSSQQLCIQYALRGQSFVMHGPPGTGKSQTIANIISELIAAGKRVLFVSEKMAALEVVYNRLKERGLDDYCLELHSHKANKREVVAELSRALTEHLKPRGTISDAELERLRTRRDQLNAYVTALHLKRLPMDASAFELLERLAELEDAPFVRSDYPRFETMDPKGLFELEELVRRLTNVWSVVEEGERFPWRGCRATSFSSETRAQWVALLDGALETIRSLTKEARSYGENLGLPVPRTIADYEWLKEVSLMVSETPRPPSSWFTQADLNKMEADAKDRLKTYADYWSSRRSLERFYDGRMFRLPVGSAERVEQALTRAKEWLAPTRDGDAGLLKSMAELTRYVEELPDKVEGWKRDADRMGGILGLPETNSLTRIQQLAELARLCEAENRPEADWLNAETLAETRELFERAREEYGRRDELRRALLETYSDELLTLDLDRLIEWFEGPGRSIFRFFRPRYYRIRNLISRASRSGKIPKSILDDLRAARELVDLQSEIDVKREKLRTSLKSYFRGGEPDFAAASEALRIAERALRIVKADRAPAGVVENLSVGSSPNMELLSLGKALRGSIRDWKSATRRLGRLVPVKRLPNTGRSLTGSPVAGVVEWANEMNVRLADLSKSSVEPLATRLADHPSTLEELVSDMRESERLQGFEANVHANAGATRAIFGRRFTGVTTDWEAVLRSLDWTRRLRRLSKGVIPPALVSAASEEGTGTVSDPRIGSRLQGLYAALDDVGRGFDAPLWGDAPQALTLDDVGERFEALRSRVDELQTWVDFKDVAAKLQAGGLGAFLSQIVERRLDRALILDVFRRSMAQGMLDRVFQAEPALREFRGQDHEQLIGDFQELDRRFIRLTAGRVIQRANELKPQGVFVQAPDSEITVLQREAAKKRRHMPIRQLFDRMPNLLGRLKPCLMMSPISVSQFLIPGRLRFDLVVFDEASQIYPEDAVGSIYRGDQLIVAGDNKQLPPTPFFQYSLDDEFDWDASAEYEFDVFDSVLDECMSIGLPVNMLRWHYRSKHDSLINFSNERFYDGRLVLFPSAMKADDDLGLKFVRVPDGVYDRGGARNNPREAEVVAGLVFDHFARHPEKTLGVVTFSLSQMNTVQDEIERRLVDHPEYEGFFAEDRLQGFFVKNLENVQGDERDVMIFSVGYGFDKDGRMTMNFGPLNKPGGERRLNVAITRAREKVIIVSSIRGSDIDLEATEAPGAQCLHHYLSYAEKGPESLVHADTSAEEQPSAIEREALDEVRRLGYEALPRVGSSSFRVDVGVVSPDDPGKFMLGVLFDGDGYRAVSTARDRERLRVQVLESLGWRIHHVWSPDWVQRRETELKRLADAMAEAERSPGRRNPPAMDAARSPGKTMKAVEVVETRGGDLPGVEPYRSPRLELRPLPEHYSPENRERYLRRYGSEVRRLLPVVVREAGPIHVDHSFKCINASLGLDRASPLLRRAFMEALGDCRRRGMLVVRGDFLWSARAFALKVRSPTEGDDETRRPIQFIPQEELRAAMTMIAGHSIGVGPESLLNETARLFGFKRIGGNVRGALAASLEASLRDGALVLEEGIVRAPNGK
jgi:hypothetical protein